MKTRKRGKKNVEIKFFRVFFSAPSSFHWSLIESAEKKMRKFHAPKCFVFPYNTLSHMVAYGSNWFYELS